MRRAAEGAAQSRTDPVVVVHGLWMPGSETILLRRRLAAHAFSPRLFRYHSVRAGLDENAARLARSLEQVPGETVHLVGHSLGGVVILRMLRQHGLSRRGSVVCLGSPLTGSLTAGALAVYPGARHVLGRGLWDLMADGGLPRWNGERPLGVIAGRLPIGFGSLAAHLPRPNDGAVTVEETRLPGATDHVVVRASHMALLFSRAAARQVICFLERGRFCHPPEPAGPSSLPPEPEGS